MCYQNYPIENGKKSLHDGLLVLNICLESSKPSCLCLYSPSGTPLKFFLLAPDCDRRQREPAAAVGRFEAGRESGFRRQEREAGHAGAPGARLGHGHLLSGRAFAVHRRHGFEIRSHQVRIMGS